MAIDEDAALDIAAVRAVEGADRARTFWTDEDRAWASRVAAEMVGEGASPDAYLSARARVALERIGERAKGFARTAQALRWRRPFGVLIAVAAFVAGVAIDQVGGAQRINLLAPPFFGLLVWNVFVYALLVLGFIVRYGDAAALGPIRRLVARYATGRVTAGRGELADATARLVRDWPQRSAPLYRARVARVLHVAAAAFAAGLIAGLYVRGLAFEYRATWESTFLDAGSVRGLLAAILSPGALVTGIPVPSAGEVAAIRAPASENAARWLHLMAATIVTVVIAPRLVLALAAWLLERHRGARVPLDLDEPYFVRLLRGFRGGPVRVCVAPYSYAVPAVAAAGLERLIRGVFGQNASLTIMASTAYGSEDALGANAGSGSPVQAIALFNATATPESEAHGAFLDRLGAHLAAGSTRVALVDESAFRDRWPGEPARLEERRASWRALCAERHVACAFATLAATDMIDAEAGLERALDEAAR